jgi:hypothetical protein
MKKIAVLLALVLCAQAVFAEDGDSGMKFSSLIDLQISTLPEAKLIFTQRFQFPFLQGNGPLTKDNTIVLGLHEDISPVSMNGMVDVVWTPIAFFQFTAGAKIGSGWNFPALGVTGIGINEADSVNTVLDNQGNSKPSSHLSSSPFDGLLWKAHAGLTLQMDFAALFPGDWNHILFQTYHEFNYRGYSRAGPGDAWYFEADAGENANGFNYYGVYTLGYQMPKSPVLDMIAFRAESDLYLYDMPGRHGWGDDLVRWTFSGIANFTISKHFSVMAILQLRTMRNFVGLDARKDVQGTSSEKNVHYKSRVLDTANPLRLDFYRLVGIITYRF